MRWRSPGGYHCDKRHWPTNNPLVTKARMWIDRFLRSAQGAQVGGCKSEDHKNDGCHYGNPNDDGGDSCNDLDGSPGSFVIFLGQEIDGLRIRPGVLGDLNPLNKVLGKERGRLERFGQSRATTDRVSRIVGGAAVVVAARAIKR